MCVVATESRIRESRRSRPPARGRPGCALFPPWRPALPSRRGVLPRQAAAVRVAESAKHVHTYMQYVRPRACVRSRSRQASPNKVCGAKPVGEARPIRNPPTKRLPRVSPPPQRSITTPSRKLRPATSYGTAANVLDTAR
ncbi:hypothetical protein DAEQUDRAFT_428776 [Daedalea quercina L-15889]|uniref:Uncharacterized protein n=1 Tax=Daedalea quercina L-15889 TaxID=1314783 RepID=A0A165NJM3_9APHY|nr:hypothetical protein DAEQUDRAFT_428776 [Daedalea quercina L-15889]